MNNAALLSANAIPVDGTYNLRFAFWNPDTGNQYAVNLRYTLLLDNGDIVDNVESFIVPATANETAIERALAKGFLIAVSVHGQTGTLQAGQLYATIGIRGGSPNDKSKILTLASNYVTNYGPVEFPLGESRATNDFRGASLGQALPDPAVGSEIAASLDFTGFVKIKTLRALLATDATVSDRSPQLILSDAGSEVFRADAHDTIPASTNAICQITTGAIPTVSGSDVRWWPVTDLPYMQSATVQTLTNNLQAGDSYQSIQIRYEAFVNF